MKRLFKIVIFTIITLSGLISLPFQARADLTITPTHVVFEGRDRFASITLINTGSEQTTYDMRWRFFTMQETGPAYKPAETSTTEFDLSKYIVFTPRRVTLAPGAKQKIRLALRRPEEVPEGDFRAHFEFAPVVEIEPNIPEEDQKASAGISINVGYTIPVILRNGEADVKIDIGNVTIDRNPKTGKLIATVPLNRSGGPYSAMGRLYLYYKSASGEEELIGQLSNANVFPEVSLRVVDIPLNKDQLEEGTLRVVMEHHDKDEEKKFIYAERTFPMHQ